MTINCTVRQKFPRTHLWVQRKPDQMVPSWMWALHTFTEYARESVTANGSPSGTATTNTVTPMIKYFTSSLAWLLFQPLSPITYVFIQNWITNITTVSMAIREPKTQQKIHIYLGFIFLQTPLCPKNTTYWNSFRDHKIFRTEHTTIYLGFISP